MCIALHAWMIALLTAPGAFDGKSPLCLQKQVVMIRERVLGLDHRDTIAAYVCDNLIHSSQFIEFIEFIHTSQSSLASTLHMLGDSAAAMSAIIHAK